MTEEQPSRSGVSRAGEQKAKALAAGLAVVGLSCVVFALLLPLIALLIVVVWSLYGGAAALLIVAVPAALIGLVLYRRRAE